MPDDSTPRGFSRPPCSNCGKAAEDAWRPFCSKRCADVDLGRWLNGRYSIPGDPVEVPIEAESDEAG